MKLVTESPKQVLIKKKKEKKYVQYSDLSFSRQIFLFLSAFSFNHFIKIQFIPSQVHKPDVLTSMQNLQTLKMQDLVIFRKTFAFNYGKLKYLSICLSIYLQTFAFLVKIQMFFIYLYYSCIKNFYWILLNSNWKFNSAFCLLPQLGINNILISFLNGAQPC